MIKKNKKEKGVLSDHYQVGKRFVPYFIHKMGQLEEVRWIDCILPELLWLGLLNNYYGLDEGAHLASSLALSAVATCKPIPKKWFAPTSSYAELNEQ